MKILNIDGEIYFESLNMYELKYSYIKNRCKDGAVKYWVLRDNRNNLIPLLRKFRVKHAV